MHGEALPRARTTMAAERYALMCRVTTTRTMYVVRDR